MVVGERRRKIEGDIVTVKNKELILKMIEHDFFYEMRDEMSEILQ